ncbi:endonuclease/exonuclease/phosphatase family protein [Kriegella aquimaris]|uniref:Endonuclease/Exonuclease/phosphatase family protein n=1 Tax=Kriegella aquimaris TaxID=192904 RepID=A0A1G9RC50_9FLAO|nr:endonuclease/exonuclease/phosphatase family protein [Kriegella aquimaris]SDM20741.1 Endonuclease/Exonuclease/phosphatase family protein [Kriegella aquimaris]
MIKKLSFLFFILFHFALFSQVDNISLISWNIRDFGKTKNSEELNQIADIVKDTDILAIQEVVSGYGGAQAVAKLSDILNRKGAKWDYVISNPTKSSKYVTERYAFIWKTRHIKIKNRGKLISALDSVIDREPYLMEFYINQEKLTLVNFHSRPFDKNPEAEIEALTTYIDTSLVAPLILAGDFNVDEAKHVFDDFRAKGFRAAISDQKTTLKRGCNGTGYLNHPIDNIFYSQGIYKIKSGVIDFVRFCDNLEKARKLSDHLPVFLEFSIP